MDKKTLLNGYHLNMDYTRELVVDVKDEDMAKQPHGFVNHPAFTLGHLVSATCLTIKLVGGTYEIPGRWDEIFRRKGPGDPQRPGNDRMVFPSKEKLIVTLDEKYEQARGLIDLVDEKMWNEKRTWKLASYMPTVGEILYFQCLMHHSWHIGQLAEWRRFMGYDSALARLMT